MTNFQVFEKAPSGIAVVYPAITIGKSGTLSINLPTWEALGSPEAVVLMYDPDEGLAAIAAAEQGTPNSYSTGTRLLAVSRFLRLLGLAGLDQSRRYRVTVKDGKAVFDVNGPHEPVNHIPPSPRPPATP